MIRKLAVLIAALIFNGCNKLNRLLDTEHVAEVSTAKPVTVQVLIWGQSNATHDDLWARLAELAGGVGVKLEFTNVAMGNTSSYDWATDWRHYGLPQALRAAAEAKRPVLALSIQGETDSETPREDFVANYRTILGIIRTASPSARCYIALCSYGVIHQGDPRGGEAEIIADGLAYQGPDVDQYRTATLSEGNGLHFNEAGDRKIAEDWFEILKPTLISIAAAR